MFPCGANFPAAPMHAVDRPEDGVYRSVDPGVVNIELTVVRCGLGMVGRMVARAAAVSA